MIHVRCPDCGVLYAYRRGHDCPVPPSSDKLRPACHLACPAAISLLEAITPIGNAAVWNTFSDFA